jgi:hypothetical protein
MTTPRISDSSHTHTHFPLSVPLTFVVPLFQKTTRSPQIILSTLFFSFRRAQAACLTSPHLSVRVRVRAIPSQPLLLRSILPHHHTHRSTTFPELSAAHNRPPFSLPHVPPTLVIIRTNLCLVPALAHPLPCACHPPCLSKPLLYSLLPRPFGALVTPFGPKIPPRRSATRLTNPTLSTPIHSTSLMRSICIQVR